MSGDGSGCNVTKENKWLDFDWLLWLDLDKLSLDKIVWPRTSLPEFLWPRASPGKLSQTSIG